MKIRIHFAIVWSLGIVGCADDTYLLPRDDPNPQVTPDTIPQHPPEYYDGPAIDIYTSADFNKIRRDLTATYRLMADIDLGSENMRPIPGAVTNFDCGALSTGFSGKLYGNGHSISNFIYFSANPNENCVGLFSNLSGAEIYDLRLQNFHIRGVSSVGALVGYARYGTKLSNIRLSGSTSEIKGMTVGGLVGDSMGGVIIEKSQIGPIRIQAVTPEGLRIGNAGGFVGSALGGFSILKSFSEANVSGLVAGGIFGNLSASSAWSGFVGGSGGIISEVEAAGTVSAKSFAGGIGGRAAAVMSLSDSLSVAEIQIENGGVAGGILGEVYDTAAIPANRIVLQRILSLSKMMGPSTSLGGFAGNLRIENPQSLLSNLIYAKDFNLNLNLPAYVSVNSSLIYNPQPMTLVQIQDSANWPNSIWSNDIWFVENGRLPSLKIFRN